MKSSHQRRSSECQFPLDFASSAALGWSEFAQLDIAQALFVTGDRYEHRDALTVLLPMGKYSIALHTLQIGNLQIYSSIRALSVLADSVKVGDEPLGSTKTLGCGEIVMCDESKLRDALANSDHNDHFDFHFNDHGLEVIHSLANLTMAYARMGFDCDGTVPIVELLDTDNQRVGAQLDFITGLDHIPTA